MLRSLTFVGKDVGMTFAHVLDELRSKGKRGVAVCAIKRLATLYRRKTGDLGEGTTQMRAHGERKHAMQDGSKQASTKKGTKHRRNKTTWRLRQQ